VAVDVAVLRRFLQWSRLLLMVTHSTSLESVMYFVFCIVKSWGWASGRKAGCSSAADGCPLAQLSRNLAGRRDAL